MTCLLEVDGVDDLVVTIILVAVEILSLASVSGADEMNYESRTNSKECVPAQHVLVEEQRVVGLRPLDQPADGLEDVGPRWDLTGVARVVSEDDHVLGPVVVAFWRSV